MKINQIIFSLFLGISIAGNLFAASEPFNNDPRNQFAQMQEPCETNQECPFPYLGEEALKEIFGRFIDKNAFDAIEDSQTPEDYNYYITKFADSIKALIRLSQTCKQLHKTLDLKKIKVLLKLLDIDISKKYNRSLLIPNITMKNQDYEILHLAICSGCDLNTVKILVCLGADINNVITPCCFSIILRIYPIDIACQIHEINGINAHVNDIIMYLTSIGGRCSHQSAEYVKSLIGSPEQSEPGQGCGLRRDLSTLINVSQTTIFESSSNLARESDLAQNIQTIPSKKKNNHKCAIV